jgi:hypothetical protein
MNDPYDFNKVFTEESSILLDGGNSDNGIISLHDLEKIKRSSLALDFDTEYQNTCVNFAAGMLRTETLLNSNGQGSQALKTSNTNESYENAEENNRSVLGQLLFNPILENFSSQVTKSKLTFKTSFWFCDQNIFCF